MVRDVARTQDVGSQNLTRRDVLQAGSLACLGLPFLPKIGERGPAPDVSAILLFLVGGPSHLDTWDPKPDAPEGIRGPFRPIATRVPGMFVSELFPKLARVADKVAFVRSIHHPVADHDAGRHLMQTGRLPCEGIDPPSFGRVLAARKGPRGHVPPNVVLPHPFAIKEGVKTDGRTQDFLGAEDSGMREALDLSGEPAAVRERYGYTRFGRNCLRARRLVERGTRFVTVNMEETAFARNSWDVHGSAPFSAFENYQNQVGPDFDHTYSALIGDLDGRGLLASTLVLAFGEFGRTPKINAVGGRDHHPACGTALFAGGPVRGGRVVGASDAIGHAPRDRPVSAAEVAATVYQALGIPLAFGPSGPEGRALHVVDEGAAPVRELF